MKNEKWVLFCTMASIPVAVERINPDGIRRYKLPLGEYSSIILASAILSASQFLKPHSKPHGAVVTFRNNIERDHLS